MRRLPRLGVNPELHPDIGSHLVIYRLPGVMLGGRRIAGRHEMLWKIIGVVAVVWIALAVIGALIKGLFPILMISAVVFGLYLLYKAVSGADKNTVSKL
jgi:hypothetical protein